MRGDDEGEVFTRKLRDLFEGYFFELGASAVTAPALLLTRGASVRISLLGDAELRLCTVNRDSRPEATLRVNAWSLASCELTPFVGASDCALTPFVGAAVWAQAATGKKAGPIVKARASIARASFMSGFPFLLAAAWSLI
jgi:hypothetical protein